MKMNTLKQICSILDPIERQKMYRLFVSILVMAGIEVVGVASIMPFMVVLASPERIESSRWLSLAYRYGGFNSQGAFLICLGFAVLAILIFSNAFTAYTTRSIYLFARMLEYALSTRLVIEYVQRPYLFFVSRNSSNLSKNVLMEVAQVVINVILPSIEILARIVVSLFMIALLVAVQPMLALVMVLLFGSINTVLYALVRRRLAKSGGYRIAMNKRRVQIITELFTGIKELMVLGRERYFIDRYQAAAKGFAAAQADYQIIAQLPRYALETIVFGGFLLIVLILLMVRGSVAQALPMLALYAMAGYRLMPAMQQIFRSAAQIKYFLPTVDTLYNDFADVVPAEAGRLTSLNEHAVSFEREIEALDVSVTYPGAAASSLNSVSLTIMKGSAIAFVGATGSGKTTLVDAIVGLVPPTAGRVLIDGKVLDVDRMRSWRRMVGYVPQQIFLADDTIEHNIALGIPDAEINKVAVERAARIANLHEFTQTLDKGYSTIIGERGVRLSGGQRQRIGIARAMYHDPSLLILDEGTSALDGITEDAIMQAIANLPQETTVIIIAHRLVTVRACDRIYLMDDGRIIDSGNYDELLNSSQLFQKLAQCR